jgi:hypothetical protein
MVNTGFPWFTANLKIKLMNHTFAFFTAVRFRVHPSNYRERIVMRLGQKFHPPPQSLNIATCVDEAQVKGLTILASICSGGLESFIRMMQDEIACLLPF